MHVCFFDSESYEVPYISTPKVFKLPRVLPLLIFFSINFSKAAQISSDVIIPPKIKTNFDANFFRSRARI